MLPRALVPTVLFASAAWPLRALACYNSMDSGAFVFTRTLWLDLLVWTVGALFLNRLVLVHVWGPTAQGQPRPSWFRRSFFLLVSAALVLLLAAVSAGGPLLSLSPYELSRCSVNRSMLLVLVAGPAVLFTLQALLFRGVGNWLFGDKRGLTFMSLVSTSVLLVMGVGMARDALVLPKLCESKSGSYSGAYIDTTGQY